MKKRFILLVDFSDNSENLVRYAWDWARLINAEIHLMHQTGVLMPAFADDISRENLASLAHREALRKMKQLIRSTLPTSAQVSYTITQEAIPRALQKLLADPLDQLVFVGLKGTGLLKKIFMGSVAIQVINKTNNIVVAMPWEMAHFSHEKIYVAVTEKHPLNILALNNFLNFIDEGQTTITFFHLSKPDEKTRHIEKQLIDLSQLFAARYHTTYAIYQGSSSFDDIKKVINNTIDELLIVQRGSRHLTDQIFRKLLINELVFEGQTPLIVLP
jgi:nucleotide-binding universal stress UspA family protein